MTTSSPHDNGSAAQRTTLAVLAGGASSRMGQSKAALSLDGRPILRYLLDRLAWPGPTLLVTAPGRQHPPGHDAFTHEAIDPVPDQGPLRGLLTALEAAPNDIVVTTVDMPGLRPQHLHWLLANFADRSSLAGLMLRHNGRIEPFPSAYRQRAIGMIRTHLTSGLFSVHGLLDHPEFAAIDAPPDWPAETWANLNRPEDVEAFRRLC